MLMRSLRHLFQSATRTRMLFTPAVCTRIEESIAQAEQRHLGEIRFAVETALPLPLIWRRITPRERAVEMFARLRVWDTQANNGVLIYVLKADRAVEIVADRGISARVADGDWQQLCGQVSLAFRSGQDAEGALTAIAGVAQLLSKHFPRLAAGSNELPNQPVLL
jgi:uncharacterized membrane protein